MNTSEFFTMYAVIVGVAIVYGTAAFAVAMWIEQGGLRRRRAAARARQARRPRSVRSDDEPDLSRGPRAGGTAKRLTSAERRAFPTTTLRHSRRLGPRRAAGQLLYTP
jgi:hypothetical protein